jgi:multisubunit Na+/H+ antiporter MnhC subunit
VARQVWITETALSTALNTSYMAKQLSIFGMVVGIALLLTGIGLLLLTLGGALRHRIQSAPAVADRREPRFGRSPESRFVGYESLTVLVIFARLHQPRAE